MKAWTRVTGAVLTAVLLAGCSAVEAMRPTAIQGDQWKLSAVFVNALNLPTGAPVKLSGLPVGKVVGVEPADYRAKVVMAIDDGVEIPVGSQFRLRYTTALGELYVEVTPAKAGKAIAEDAVIDGNEVFTAPTIEDTLASASLLVNGGNLGQVQTIVDELNTALDGRVGATRGLLTETDRFMVAALDSTREIDRVLRSLASSSKILNERQATINRALKELRPAAKVLADNTDELAALLRSTDRMAVATDKLVRRTRADLRTVVIELGPVLDEVLALEGKLVPGLDTLHDFSTRLDNAVPNDYLNMFFMFDVGTLTGQLPGDQDGEEEEGGEETEGPLPVPLPTELPTILPSELPLPIPLPLPSLRAGAEGEGVR